MLRKIIGIFMVLTIAVTMSVSAGAENAEKNVSEISPISSSTRTNNYNFNTFTLSNGWTEILYSTENNGFFFVKPPINSSSVTVTLITHLSSSQSNLDMGYYTTANGYVECPWSQLPPSSGDYTYTCTMVLTEGYYKFFISNNTANSLTFTNTTLSY